MIYFIVNPVAGKGEYKKIIIKIKQYMNKNNFQYKIWLTKNPEHATFLARLAIRNGANRIIAVGGDGTLQEVCSGMVNTDVPLAVLPFGSGNDFCKTLGISKDIDENLRLAIHGNPKKIDLVEANGKYFINISSVGLDAKIVASANEIKKQFGRSSYFVSVFKNIFNFKPLEAVIIADNAEYHGKYTLIATANGKFYGGVFNITPDASINDGLLDICIIESMPKIKLFFLFPTVIFGKHLNIKNVKIIRSEKLEIFLKHSSNLNMDGNIYESGKYLKYILHKDAVNLIY